jgi:hypothetical protein
MDTNVKPRFKVGVSNNPKRRRREIERTIQQQHGNDKIVKLLWQKECADAYDVELQTHVYLKPFNDQFYTTNGSTEWFNTSLKKIYSTIGSALRWYKQKPVSLPKGMIRDNINGRIIKKAYLTKDQITKIEENNNVNI